MITSGATIGIVGGGQLGRMLAVAASELGYHVHIYCPEAGAPAFEVSQHFTCAAYDDNAALEAFAKSVDVVTIEFENVSTAGLAKIESITPVFPAPSVVSVCQHRLREKHFVQSLGIETAPFQAVTSLEQLHTAIAQIGCPAVLKTTRMGYDGKGQQVIHTPAQADAAWAQLNTDEAILEGFVDFIMEVSVVVARSSTGEVTPFVPVHNIHRHHILHQTIAPAPINAALLREAETMASRIAEGLDLVGILAVEMFVTKDSRLLVNELAPRPHNSGHWTMDACVVSQFEQTIRAICGLPLGDPTRICDAVMTNLIGDEVNDSARYLSEPRTRLHLYGKAEARPGRKMGHVTELLLRS